MSRISLAAFILLLALLLQIASSRPADEVNKSPKTRRINNNNRRHRTDVISSSPHRHSSRGLKQVGSIDYDADSTDPASPTKRMAANANKKAGRNKRGRRQQQSRLARRAELINDEDAPADLLGLGVFGDMRKFFDELKTNLEADATKEIKAPDQQNKQGDVVDGGDDEDELLPNYLALKTASQDQQAEEERRFKSPRLRGFVSMGPESGRFKSAHHYDPAILWTGLGR